MDSLPPPATSSQAPTPTSVYKYYDTHGILLYVGITSRGSQRNREHDVGKEWWSFVHRQDVEHHPSRAAALARESALIGRYHPPFNTQHNPDHERTRAIYFLFAALPDAKSVTFGGRPAPKSARRLCTGMQHKLPLTKHSETATAVTYTHKAAHVEFAHSINDPFTIWGHKVVAA